MMIPVDAENVFDKIHHAFYNKTQKIKNKK